MRGRPLGGHPRLEVVLLDHLELVEQVADLRLGGVDPDSGATQDLLPQGEDDLRTLAHDPS
jgi:hypothetical protein